MRLGSDSFAIRWGAYAGLVSAIAGAFFFFAAPQPGSSPLWDVVGLLTTAFPFVIYWYGMSRLGTRLKSPMLHWAAILSLLGSIFTDASSFASTYFSSAFFSHNADGIISMIFTFGAPIGLILAGAAMLNFRERFGELATLYGVLSLLLAALMLWGYPSMFVPWMNIALFFVGGVVLLRASR